LESSLVQIIKYPHPTLRHKSKPLRRVDGEVKKIVRGMFDLMYRHKGIGLAANQVDLPYRLLVVNVTGDPALRDEEYVFINPVITDRKGSSEDREGCLSFPEIYAPVVRPERIVVNAYALNGEEFSYEFDGLYARVVQHEADHLDGILFIDRLSPANRLAVKEDLAALAREFNTYRQRGRIPDDAQIAARLAELEAART
jgi:peptide deformylase